MTPATVFLLALAVILGRIAWETVTSDRRLRQRAVRRAQRALKERDA